MKARFNTAFIVYAISSAAVGVVAYLYLPGWLLPPVVAFMRNLWTVLGPLGAFAVQIVLQLISLGEGKSLNEVQARRLSDVVDQRLRFVWYIVATTLLALLLSASGASLADIGDYDRLMRGITASALAFAYLSALFSMRLPAILHEIKDYRWRLASEQREADERNAGIANLRRERLEPVVEMKEPERRNGTL